MDAEVPFDPSSLPSKLVGAGLLIRDPAGRVLIVKPTYKAGWEVPGGLVEPGESPREAARREALEELGSEIGVGDLLCVHYSVGPTGRDGIMFVFDGGRSDTPAGDYVLPADELSEAAFVAPSDLHRHLPAVLVTRLLAAIDAHDAGHPTYLER